MERIGTIIIGGGQAGLAASYFLCQSGREHVVLERAARAANAWRSERWDSFTLVTPNLTLRMPGAEYTGDDPEGFLPREEIVAYFDRYVERFRLPVRGNTRVVSIEPGDSGGFRIQTDQQLYLARHVVVATGYAQRPKIHPAAAGISPGVTQLHSSAYRNPGALPPGGVLVVGSAQSGSQIAEELYQHGRKVFLSTGSAGRLPRRYRGKDIVAWLHMMGFFDRTPEQLSEGTGKPLVPPHLSGSKGGHTLNLHQFARDGVTLLGRLSGAADGRVFFAPDLYENLGKVDRFERDVVKKVDQFIQMTGLNAPVEELPQLSDGCDQPIIEELDLHRAGIGSVIWATGYTHDYSLVKLPVLDEHGYPVHTNGVTRWPGLYFTGLPGMPAIKTAMLLGVGDAAQQIAAYITEGVSVQ